jgi:NADH-quinone oxidoreductase subunit M
MRIAAPIFSEEMLSLAPWIAGFGVFSIIYGALIALGSNNLKRVIACSSISHMGFVLMGLAAMTYEGLSGAVYQMYSHGLISAMLFLVAGVLYTRTQSLEINKFKGLSQVMPKYGTFVAIAFFAALGLPGFSGFLAELFIFLGSFKSTVIPIWIPLLGLVGLVLTAAYFLWTYQRMYLGKYSTNTDITANVLPDLSIREWALLATLAVLALLFGIMPSLLLDVVSPFVDELIANATN